MARTLEDIRRDALALTPEEKSRLLQDLIADLDGVTEQNVEREWVAEAERRYRSLQAGETTARPAEEVLADARRKLREG